MNPHAVFESLASAKLPSVPVHLAIGIFDGVHLGHQAVIEPAMRAAREDGGLAGVLTFFPHPSRLLAPDHATNLILPPDVKRWRLLNCMGVDFVIEEPFTAGFASIAAGEFVPHLMRHIPGLAGIYVGENWRFGRGREGDVPLLDTICREKRLRMFSAPRVTLDGEPISSTRIRDLIKSGGIGVANKLLGYAYTSLGTVVAGRRLGRTIGFPTLNIPWEPECRPAFGVYGVRVSREGVGERRPAVANYGVRPTVEAGQSPLLEVHLLGECDFGTGDRLRIEWCEYGRPECKFPSVEALRNQIEADKSWAEAYFNKSG